MKADEARRELDEIRLAVATLSVQLDALAVRQAPSEGSSQTEKSFAQRAVKAMRFLSEIED